MTQKELTNLFRVVNGFRYFGAGCKVTRSIYKFPDTYWIISRVKLSKDQNHGKAYGRLVWRGKPQLHDKPIHSARKAQWRLLSAPDYTTYKGTEGSHDGLVKDAEKWFSENGTWVNPPEKSDA